MPKIVNPQKRKEEIAQAVFTILYSEGLQGVTLARIAEHTGLAIGSIRHYFPNHKLLIESAISVLIHHIDTRIQSHYSQLATDSVTSHEERLYTTVRVIEELLPFDDQRRKEAVLWLRIINESIHNPLYQPYAKKLVSGMRGVISQILSNALEYPIDSRADVEIERLASLVDGLTIDMLTKDSGMSYRKTRLILLRHIDQLSQETPRN